MPPLFSVVVVTYNNADYLGIALESVRRQRFTDYELIVVDDGSTDHSPQLLRDWKSRATVIHQENAGVAAARNTGCAAARGRYCAFLDSDDVWFEWTLSTLAELIDRTDQPSVIGLAFRNFREDRQLEDVAEGPLVCDTSRDYLEGARRHAFHMGTAHTVLRLDVIRQAGGFRTDFPAAEDSDLFLRAGTAPGFAMMLRPLVLGYRKHEDSLTTNVSNLYYGALGMIRQERSGAYPGGRARQAERWLQVLVRTRAASVKLLGAGRVSWAWDLYRQTFKWNLASGRLRYLFVLPLMIVVPRLRSIKTRRARPTSALNRGT